MGARARVLLAATLALLLGARRRAGRPRRVGDGPRRGGALRGRPGDRGDVPATGHARRHDGTSFAYHATPTRWPPSTAPPRCAASATASTPPTETPSSRSVAGLTADADYSRAAGSTWSTASATRSSTWAPGTASLRKGDVVVFAQNPDATFSRGTKVLRLRFAPAAPSSRARPSTITVLGDDIAKANSAAEATRWALDPVADPSIVEKPADFAPVAGATLHVGSRVYVDGAAGDVADGKIAIADLPKGTYGVWAEMAMDADVHLRALRHATDRTSTRPARHSRSPRPPRSPAADSPRARGFTLDKRCDVIVTVVQPARQAARRHDGARPRRRPSRPRVARHARGHA